MKQRPILFSTPMVQGIQEDRKTQTRRVMKPQPELNEFEGNKTGNRVKGWLLPGTQFFWPEGDTPDATKLECPYGQAGDVLWVREAWAEPVLFDGAEKDFYYRADYNGIDPFHVNKWKPSIFMPRAAARIFLQITNVRIERLHDITESDAQSEGVECKDYTTDGETHISTRDYLQKPYASGAWPGFSINNGMQFRKSFNSLWRSINGEESWRANPWVWVIEFERIAKPTA